MLWRECGGTVQTAYNRLILPLASDYREPIKPPIRLIKWKEEKMDKNLELSPAEIAYFEALIDNLVAKIKG